ncbi:MAG: 16S rRNA (guanine(966)-N(2))-methyltransferase RsmD [Candidatus Microbacterium phytovorans]|uniref:16S rRNA (Guanine(966)-N(2))-methyltransferase RsmD n=1 Tax=Candidatus Microbacterium phytovorans TaxID=3121374 RepID=A0AAJ6B434_9MICO|nr:16S rRNA (guanine(966)-N(2))-methyltransferase RsmD [Microbacterium sp.]WEK14568.1 MAG: 16S rRNA (guanine(966)-N(2))-methyltransferase RsmD [Microbacterium sp.]
MTRIIGGAAGSLTLLVPDAGTRPTSDRVRESLFGALEAADLLEGAAVADLYAGSGALGLEAVSRGAVSADLVERAARAATVAERNVRTVQRAVPAAALNVHRMTADAFLRAGTSAFDVVFIDPPYDIPEPELATTLELLAPRLRPDAVVIVERATRSPAPALPDSLVSSRSKRYGDTTLWWVSPR